LTYQLYYIEWLDAAKYTGKDAAWQAVDDLDAEPPVVATVGWQVKESKHGILIATSIDKDDMEADVMPGALIPKKMIVKKRKMEVPE